MTSTTATTGAFPEYLDREEAAVINKLITRILDAGMSVSVFDEAEKVQGETTSRKAIQAETGHTGMTIYRVHRDGKAIGSVTLIHGNGEDVISDMAAADQETLDYLDTLDPRT